MLINLDTFKVRCAGQSSRLQEENVSKVAGATSSDCEGDLVKTIADHQYTQFQEDSFFLRAPRPPQILLGYPTVEKRDHSRRSGPSSL